jgi:hypothetical protein
MKKGAAVFVCALLFTSGGLADDWPAATAQNVFSENGRYFVRILPGDSVGPGQAKCTPPKGPFSASWFGH